jgi:hypothetical protein
MASFLIWNRSKSKKMSPGTLPPDAAPACALDERSAGPLLDGAVALPDGRSNERSAGTVAITSGLIASLLA